MRTDELIVELARSARPVKPLPPPGLRAATWLAVAALVVVIPVVLLGPRHDLLSALSRPVFLGSLAALILTLAGGAFVAFELSVPGGERTPMRRALTVAAVAAWSVLWLAMWLAGAPAERPTAAFHSMCAIEIGVCSLITGGLLSAMIARAAPLHLLWTAAISSVAAMATGAAAAQLICPVDDPRHQFIGHVLVALLMAAVAAIAGRRAIAR